MTYPPPYDPNNDPLRKHDDAGQQGTPAPGDGYQQPGYPAPGYQQPGYGYQQPGYQQPGYQQPGYQQSGYQPPAYGYPPQRETNSNAIIALISGIATFVICGLGVIPAIIFGNKAIEEIKASGGTQDGLGMAQAGRILGWIGVALWAIGIGLFVILLIAAGAPSS